MSAPPSLWDQRFRLALASGSATRRRLLAAAGLPFEVVAAAVDERRLEAAMPDAAPDELALALARAKALSANAPAALAIGADQVLSLDGALFHKCATREEALRSLSALSGRTHRLTSAFALARDGEVLACGVDTAEMTMRALDAAALALYLDVAGPEALGSVGVYQWEGLGAHLFERVAGDHSTILGLPMLKLLAALRGLGALRL
ncbi:MAG TPA: Maf family protein [Roseiarcus sp.]|nr:Maf family protein [Roseiarcus sp.]